MLFKNCYSAKERPKRVRRLPLKYLDYSREDKPKANHSDNENSSAFKKNPKKHQNTSDNSDSECVSKPQSQKRKLNNSGSNINIKGQGLEDPQGKHSGKKILAASVQQQVRTMGSRKFINTDIKENKTQVSPFKKGSYKKDISVTKTQVSPFKKGNYKKDISVSSDLSRAIKRKSESNIEISVTKKKRKTASSVERILVGDTGVGANFTTRGYENNVPVERIKISFKKSRNYSSRQVCFCGKTIEERGLRYCNICKSDSAVQHLYPLAYIKCCRVQLVSISTVDSAKSESKCEKSTVPKVGKELLSPAIKIDSSKDCLHASQKGKQWIKKTNSKMIYDKTDSTIKVKKFVTAKTFSSSASSIGSKRPKKPVVQAKSSKIKNEKVKLATVLSFVCGVCEKKFSTNVQKLIHELNHSPRILKVVVKKLKPNQVKNIVCDSEIRNITIPAGGKDKIESVAMEELEHTNRKDNVDMEYLADIVGEGNISGKLPSSCENILDIELKNGTSMESKDLCEQEEKIEEADAVANSHGMEEDKCAANNNHDMTSVPQHTVNDAIENHVESSTIIIAVKEESPFDLNNDNILEVTNCTMTPDTVSDADDDNNFNKVDTCDTKTINTNAIHETSLVDTENETSVSTSIGTSDGGMVNTKVCSDTCSISVNECNETQLDLTAIEDTKSETPTIDMSATCATSSEVVHEVNTDSAILKTKVPHIRDIGTSDTVGINMSNDIKETEIFKKDSDMNVSVLTEADIAKDEGNTSANEESGDINETQTYSTNKANEINDQYIKESSITYKEVESDDNRATTCETVNDEVATCQDISEFNAEVDESHADGAVESDIINNMDDSNITEKVKGANVNCSYNYKKDGSDDLNTGDILQSVSAGDASAASKTTVKDTDDTFNVNCSVEASKCNETTVSETGTCNGDTKSSSKRVDCPKNSGYINMGNIHKAITELSVPVINNEDKINTTEETEIAASNGIPAHKAVDDTSDNRKTHIEKINASSELAACSFIGTGSSDSVCDSNMQDSVKDNNGFDITGAAVPVLTQESSDMNIDLPDASPQVSGVTCDIDTTDSNHRSKIGEEFSVSDSINEIEPCDTVTERGLPVANDRIGTSPNVDTCTNGVMDAPAETLQVGTEFKTEVS